MSAPGHKVRPMRLVAAAFCFLAVALLGWAVQHGLTTSFDEAGMRALSGVDAPGDLVCAKPRKPVKTSSSVASRQDSAGAQWQGAPPVEVARAVQTIIV